MNGFLYWECLEYRIVKNKNFFKSKNFKDVKKTRTLNDFYVCVNAFFYCKK